MSFLQHPDMVANNLNQYRLRDYDYARMNTVISSSRLVKTSIYYIFIYYCNVIDGTDRYLSSNVTFVTDF